MASRWLPKRAWARIFLGNPPERQLFPTPGDYDEAIRRIIQTGLVRGWRAGLIGIVTGLGFSMPMFLTSFLGFRPVIPYFPPLIGGMIYSFLGCVPTFIVMTFLFRRIGRKRIRRELIGLGMPVCMACGYCLRGVRSSRCPECGWVLDSKTSAALAQEMTHWQSCNIP